MVLDRLQVADADQVTPRRHRRLRDGPDEVRDHDAPHARGVRHPLAQRRSGPRRDEHEAVDCRHGPPLEIADRPVQAASAGDVSLVRPLVGLGDAEVDSQHHALLGTGARLQRGVRRRGALGVDHARARGRGADSATPGEGTTRGTCGTTTRGPGRRPVRGRPTPKSAPRVSRRTGDVPPSCAASPASRHRPSVRGTRVAGGRACALP